MSIFYVISIFFSMARQRIAAPEAASSSLGGGGFGVGWEARAVPAGACLSAALAGDAGVPSGSGQRAAARAKASQQAHRANHRLGIGNTASGDIHRAAVPDARQHDVGTDAQRTGCMRRQQFDRNVPLVVQHRHIQIVYAFGQQYVGAARAVDAMAFRLQQLHRRFDQAAVFGAEQPILGGMRIDAEDADRG